MAPLAVAALLTFSAVARADVETVDRNGIRWRWQPATHAVEERVVTIPGRWETRSECVTDPGHWEKRARYVWRPGPTIAETRTRTIPGHWVRHPWGNRWEPERTITETTRSVQGGRWEVVTEQVWVAGPTRWVERQVWIPERHERQSVLVEKPGRWVRVCDPPVCTPDEPSTKVTPIPMPVRKLPVVVAPSDGSQQVITPLPSSGSDLQVFEVGPDLKLRRRGPNW